MTTGSTRIFPDNAVLDVGNCIICESKRAPDDAGVFQDDLWACAVTPGYEVPGWFFLRARRHALGWQELSDGELDTFAHRMKALVEAISEATGAPTTCLMNFGENYGHFHCVVIARGTEIEPADRGGNILKLRADNLDRAASFALVPAIRAAYGGIAGHSPLPEFLEP